MNTKSVTSLLLSSVILTTVPHADAKLRITIKSKDIKNAAAVVAGVATAGAVAASGGDAGDVVIAGILAGVGTKIILDALDHDDRRALYECQNHALHGRRNDPYRWESRPGYSGEVVILREGYHYQTRQVCREYRSTISVPGKTETTTSYACVDRNGSWQDTEVREVVFGGPIMIPAPAPAPVIIEERHDHGYGELRLVDYNEMSTFVSTMSSQDFDSNRTTILAEYMALWSRGNVRIAAYQMNQILGTFEWDSHRMTALQLLLPISFYERGQIEEVVSSFSSSFSQNQARQMLVGHLLQR